MFVSRNILHPTQVKRDLVSKKTVENASISNVKAEDVLYICVNNKYIFMNSNIPTIFYLISVGASGHPGNIHA
jgi:hypothetical protein